MNEKLYYIILAILIVFLIIVVGIQIATMLIGV